MLQNDFYETLDNYYLSLNLRDEVELLFKNQVFEDYLQILYKNQLKFNYLCQFNSILTVKKLIYLRAYQPVDDEMSLYQKILENKIKIQDNNILDKINIVNAEVKLVLLDTQADVIEGDKKDREIHPPQTFSSNNSFTKILITGIKNQKYVQIFGRNFKNTYKVYIQNYFNADFTVIRSNDQIFTYCNSEIE